MDTFFLFCIRSLNTRIKCCKAWVRVLKSGTDLYKTHAHISLLCVPRERQFPLAFYGGTVSEVDCKFSHWVTCISQRRETTAVFAAY